MLLVAVFKKLEGTKWTQLENVVVGHTVVGKSVIKQSVAENSCVGNSIAEHSVVGNSVVENSVVEQSVAEHSVVGHSVIEGSLSDYYNCCLESVRIGANEKETKDFDQLLKLCVAFDLLAVQPRKVLDLRYSDRRKAAFFAMYNYVRICNIIENYEARYPPLIPWQKLPENHLNFVSQEAKRVIKVAVPGSILFVIKSSVKLNLKIPFS